MVAPAQRLQDALQAKTLGAEHWINITESFNVSRNTALEACEFHKEMSMAGLHLLQEREYHAKKMVGKTDHTTVYEP